MHPHTWRNQCCVNIHIKVYASIGMCFMYTHIFEQTQEKHTHTQNVAKEYIIYFF